MRRCLPGFRTALWLAFCLMASAVAAAPASREAAAGAELGRIVEGYWQEHLRLHPLEATLLAHNASPGGAADLLAGTLFIDSLERPSAL